MEAGWIGTRWRVFKDRDSGTLTKASALLQEKIQTESLPTVGVELCSSRIAARQFSHQLARHFIAAKLNLGQLHETAQLSSDQKESTVRRLTASEDLGPLCHSHHSRASQTYPGARLELLCSSGPDGAIGVDVAIRMDNSKTVRYSKNSIHLNRGGRLQKAHPRNVDELNFTLHHFSEVDQPKVEAQVTDRAAHGKSSTVVQCNNFLAIRTLLSQVRASLFFLNYRTSPHSARRTGMFKTMGVLGASRHSSTERDVSCGEGVFDFLTTRRQPIR